MLALAQCGHKIQPLAVRQTAVEHKDIIASDTGHGVGIRNGADMICEHIAAAQRFKQRARHFRLILKKQNSQ
ncbi:hypothetical protein thsrh120_36260 [Rhizobium sp. No.120]